MLPHLHIGNTTLRRKNHFLRIVLREIHRRNGEVFLTVFYFYGIGAKIGVIVYLACGLPVNHIVLCFQQTAHYINGDLCAGGKDGFGRIGNGIGILIIVILKTFISAKFIGSKRISIFLGVAYQRIVAVAEFRQGGNVDMLIVDLQQGQTPGSIAVI